MALPGETSEPQMAKLSYAFDPNKYFCSKNINMLLVFGENVADYPVSTGFQNAEGAISDFTLDRACPVPE